MEFDLSGAPRVVFTNQSSGTQAGCKFFFSIVSPEGFPLVQEVGAMPDKVGIWSKVEKLLPAANSFTFGTYKIRARVLTDKAEVVTITREIKVARPAGNKIGGNDNYGQGKLYYELQCNSGVILAEDRTNTVYQGHDGKIVSRKITFAPPDLDEEPIKPVALKGYKTVKFEIPFAAAGFYLYLDTIVNYLDEAANTSVTIKYVRKHCFPIFCNIDFCKLACEISHFENKVANNPTPDNVAKLTLINSMFNRALIGQQYPSCGIDVTKLISQIAGIAQFDSCFTCFTDGKGNSCGCATPATTIPCVVIKEVELVTTQPPTTKPCYNVTSVVLNAPRRYAEYIYSVNPFSKDLAVLDALSLTYKKEIIKAGDPISLAVAAMPANSYLLVRIPADEPTPKTWFNTALNNGQLPDQAFLAVSSSAKYKYLVTRVGITLDNSKPLIFNV